MPSPGLEIVVSCDGVELAREAVESGSYTFGSSPACEFYIDAPRISPRHFQVTIRRDGTMILRNLPTPAGTFLDGQQITVPTPFRPGQEIAMGDVKIAFCELAFAGSGSATAKAESTAPTSRPAARADGNQKPAEAGKAGVAPIPEEAEPVKSHKEIPAPKKKKFLGRRPSPVSLKAPMIIGLVGLLILVAGSAVFITRTVDERNQAVLERDRADAARRKAETARHAAEAARHTAEAAQKAAETAQQAAETAKQESETRAVALQNDLLKSYTVLGRTMLALGDLEGQVSALTKATEVGTALMKSNPKDFEAARLTGEAYANIGAAYFRQKNLKEARPMYERYLEIIGQLAKEVPENYQYQVNTAEARIKMVSCQDLTTEQGKQDFVTATRDGVAVLEKLQQKGGLQPPEEATLKMYQDALKELGEK